MHPASLLKFSVGKMIAPTGIHWCFPHPSAFFHTQSKSVKNVQGAVINSSKQQIIREQKIRGSCDLDPEAFTWLKVYTYRDHLAALESVEFRQRTNAECQHLDVGCGPGNFLSDCLLPRLRPFRRVVAIDVSLDMLRHARRHYQQRGVSYEQHDIENGDPCALRDKYGLFDRVFAFLTFHFVSDLEKGYQNVHRLLKDGGECLTVNFTRTGITDVWHRMYQKQEWRPYLPDLKAVFAERFCFDRPVPEEELMEREERAVTYAGLNLISCKTCRSQWVLPSLKACVDLYVPLFKMNAKVPEEKQRKFIDAFQSTIYEASDTTAGPITFDYDIMVTHSQKRPLAITFPFMQKSLR